MTGQRRKSSTAQGRMVGPTRRKTHVRAVDRLGADSGRGEKPELSTNRSIGCIRNDPARACELYNVTPVFHRETKAWRSLAQLHAVRNLQTEPQGLDAR